MEQKIYYRKARTFGQVFTDSFGYIKQNFRSFFGAILAFSLPFIVIVGLLLGVVISSAFSAPLRLGGNSFFQEMFGILFLIIILMLLMQAVYTTVVNQHILLNEQLPAGEKVKLNDIGKIFFRSFWRVLGNCLLLGLIAIVALLIYGFISTAISSALSALGMVGIFLAIVFELCISFILTPVIGYVFITTILAVQKDKVGVITALGKVFRYLKGNFWKTWCVSVVAYIISYICSFVVMIPAIIFFALQMFSRIDGMQAVNTQLSATTIISGSIIFVITIALAMCVYTLFYLMCIFQYTGLEEKKEGKNIQQKIENI